MRNKLTDTRFCPAIPETAPVRGIRDESSVLSRTTQKSTRVALVLALAILLLALVTASVWAATRGAMLRNNLLAALQASLTATPTKTPQPETPQPQLVPVQLAMTALTSTPMPTMAPPPTAQVDTAEAKKPPELVAISRQYGIDPGRRFVVVDVATQKMIIWDPGHPVRELPVSTGDESRGYRTHAWYGLIGRYVGTFQAFGVYADEGWYLFEDAGSILIHGAPYLVENGVKVYEAMDALGKYPASRGCIRLSPEDARWFTQWNPKGVPLAILPRPSG